MFSVTALGHQGWLIATEANSILIDPLLTNEFGRGPSGCRYPLTPTRIFDLSQLPPLDAIVLSHEHEDHLDLASLHLLSRETPLYLSERSSEAAFTILREMGFAVRPLGVGEQLCFGNLRLQSFGPDHVRAPQGDEWDVLPYLVMDDRGHGSFFTAIDVHVSPYIAMKLLPTLQKHGGVKQSEPKLLQAYSTEKNYPILLWATAPEPVIPTAYPEAPPQPPTLTEVERHLRTNRSFIVNAGLTLRFLDGELHELGQSSVVAISPTQDSREAPSPHPGNFAPITNGEMNEQDWQRLEQELQGYAAFLYASPSFRRFYSIQKQSPQQMTTFAFFLRSAVETRSYFYSPQARRFVRSEKKSYENFRTGCECWAKDLLNIFEGSFEPRVLTRWHSYWWSPSPEELSDLVWQSFVSYFHPLRRPAQVLKSWRRRHDELRKHV